MGFDRRRGGSDALSTACMVLSETELHEVMAQNPSWLVFLETDGVAGRLAAVRCHL